MIGAFSVRDSLSFGNMKLRVQKLFHSVMGNSNVFHQSLHFMNYLPTNIAGSFFYVNKLLEIFREMTVGVVAIEGSSG